MEGRDNLGEGRQQFEEQSDRRLDVSMFGSSVMPSVLYMVKA
jgi:hypothetical protein